MAQAGRNHCLAAFWKVLDGKERKRVKNATRVVNRDKEMMETVSDTPKEKGTWQW